MPFKHPDIIETARYLIRLAEERDLADLLTINGDDAVTEHLPYASWQSQDDAQAWFSRMQVMHTSGSGWQFVIVNKASGCVIGSALLFRYEEGSARAELGYVLGRAQWGTGAMREALQALISSAFSHFELRRLEAEVNPLNLASNGLLKRLGFTQEGVLRKRWTAKSKT